MKDSSVKWIRQIPKNWTIIPLKSLFGFGKGLPITKENLQTNGVPVISYRRNKLPKQLVFLVNRIHSTTKPPLSTIMIENQRRF